MRDHTVGDPSRQRECRDKSLMYDQQGMNIPERTKGKVVRRKLLTSVAYWSPFGIPTHPDLIN